MRYTVGHDRNEESMESKVRWFRSMPLSERMDMLCYFTDLALELNPKLAYRKHAEQTQRNIRIISAS
jgi:hypothetical protein